MTEIVDSLNFSAFRIFRFAEFFDFWNVSIAIFLFVKFEQKILKPFKDHATWTRAEEYAVARPSWKIDQSNPGSDLAGEAAAALAAASIVRVFILF